MVAARLFLSACFTFGTVFNAQVSPKNPKLELLFVCLFTLRPRMSFQVTRLAHLRVTFCTFELFEPFVYYFLTARAINQVWIRINHVGFFVSQVPSELIGVDQSFDLVIG